MNDMAFHSYVIFNNEYKILFMKTLRERYNMTKKPVQAYEKKKVNIKCQNKGM